MLAKILRWFRPESDPEAEAEAQRVREEMETVRTSQLSGAGGGNLPPSRDVTDPNSGS